jgi:hypothetical protein
LIVALLVASHARAAEKVLVVSLKPTEQLFADVDYLFRAAGLQQMSQFILPQLKSYVQGVNEKQPIGVVVLVEQSEFIPLGFLPVTNLDTLLGQLQQQLGEPVDAGDGVLELLGPQPLFVKQQGGWAYFGQNKESLKQLPNDPVKLLDGLETEYEIGVRAFIKNIPDAFKQMAIRQIKDGLDRGLANTSDAAGRQMAEAQVAQLTQLIQDTDVLTFGWQIDPNQKCTYLDISLKARAGSEMANQLEASRNVTTRHAGFLAPDAAIRANITSVLPPQQVDQAVATVDRLEQQILGQLASDSGLDNRTRDAAQKLLGTFFQIARSTVKSGKFDSCTSVILKPKAATLIAAGQVASGSEVESALKQLVELAKNGSELSVTNVKFNADQHAGVRFHTMSVPIPAEEQLRLVLGDTLDIAVGVSDSSAYVALGTDGLEQLKKAIDASAGGEQTVEPFHLEIGLLPILKFAQSVHANPLIDGVIQLVGGDGKDHIRIRTSVDEQGVLYRFELEEGVLKILGQAGQMVGAGGF